MSAREMLIQLYRDYFNNYLTVELFAEHHGLTRNQASNLLFLAKEVAQSEHPEA